MEKENMLTVFSNEQFGELQVCIINGKEYFGATNTAKMLGYANPHDAIGRHCKKNGVVKHEVIDNMGRKQEINLITEGNLYRLIAKSKLPSAELFESWVFDDVIPSINRNGAYVSPNITEEQEEKLDKYSTNKKIKNTFKFCNIESIEQEFKECMIYYKNKDGKEKNAIQNTVINALNDRKQTLIDSGKGSFALVLAEVVNTISKKKTETSNKRNGQTIRYKNGIIDKQTQIINEKDEELSNLESKIAYLNPSIEEYMVVHTHGISENYLYEKVFSDYKGEYITVKTNTYKNWIRNFPSHQVTPKEELNVDWDRPIVVFIKFDCMPRFDKQNLLKASIDQLIGREYAENDNIIDKMIVEKNKDVESYKDGKIYFYIRNAD